MLHAVRLTRIAEPLAYVRGEPVTALTEKYQSKLSIPGRKTELPIRDTC